MAEPIITLTAIKIFFFTIDTIRKFLPSLKPMNPKIFQEKYYEKHREKIDGLEKKLRERENEDTSERHFILSRINPKLRAIADRYAFRSDLAWGGTIEQRYKSAWFNVLSGDAYKLAGALQDAGAQFHYAAHGFRELGVYDQAARYYRKSTLCFKESGEVDLAIRACRRAMAIYRYQTGEESKADKLENILDEWQNVER